jgi:hypothetical protein
MKWEDVMGWGGSEWKVKLWHILYLTAVKYIMRLYHFNISTRLLEIVFLAFISSYSLLWLRRYIKTWNIHVD